MVIHTGWYFLNQQTWTGSPCRNGKDNMKKIINIKGMVTDNLGIRVTNLEVMITSDTVGKSLSINDGNTQFTVPLEPVIDSLNEDTSNEQSN